MIRSLRRVLAMLAIIVGCCLAGCGGGGGPSSGGNVFSPPVLSQPAINPTTVDFVGGPRPPADPVTLSVNVSGTLSEVSMRADIRRQSDGQTFVKTNLDFTPPPPRTGGSATLTTTFNTPSNSGTAAQVYSVTFTASDVSTSNPRFNPATLPASQIITVTAPQNPGGAGGPGLPF